MPQDTLTAILAPLFGLLTHFLVFVFGQRWERRRQSLIIRAKMLDPIEEWLEGAERMSGMLGDTFASVTAGSPLPISYDFDQRRQASQFMSERTNRVFGILNSKQLRTWGTRRLSNRLSDVIGSIDSLVKYQMLPSESEILDRDRTLTLTSEFVSGLAQMKLQFDQLVQEAHSLIAKIRNALS